MNNRFALSLVSIFMVWINPAWAFDPPLAKGKEIFTTRCAACHNVNKQLTGPALAGIAERRSFTWIVNFIRSSQTLVKNGDKDAISLFEQFNKIPMPDHSDLTVENIKDVVEYIKSESQPDLTASAPFRKPGMRRPKHQPLSIERDYGFFIGYITSIGLLILVLLFAVHVSNIRKQIPG